MKPLRAALAAVVIGWAGSALAALTADYQFQSTLASSVPGAPALVDVGVDPNTYIVDSVDGVNRVVLHFVQDSGVALSPTTGVTNGSTYTIVILAKLDSEQGFNRYVAFDPTADEGLYVTNDSITNTGALTFFDLATGPGKPIVNDTYRQIALTRSAGGTLVGYVDGVQQFSVADPGGAGVVSAAKTLRFFIDDNGEAAEDGEVARIRVYDTALSPSEIAELDRLPPVFIPQVPALSPMAMLALAALLSLAAAIALRRRRSSGRR